MAMRIVGLGSRGDWRQRACIPPQCALAQQLQYETHFAAIGCVDSASVARVEYTQCRRTTTSPVRPFRPFPVPRGQGRSQSVQRVAAAFHSNRWSHPHPAATPSAKGKARHNFALGRAKVFANKPWPS